MLHPKQQRGYFHPWAQRGGGAGRGWLPAHVSHLPAGGTCWNQAAPVRRCKSLPGSPGKVSRGHFSSRTSNSKAHKLTQNDYRVLQLCINSTQDENTPGKMGEMKAKIHFPPNFSCSCCSSMRAGLQHVLLMGLLLHGTRDITLQHLSSPWVSAFISFSLLLAWSLSAGLKRDSPAKAALPGRKKLQADHQIPFSTPMPHLVWVSVFCIVTVFKS